MIEAEKGLKIKCYTFFCIIQAGMKNIINKK